MAACKNEATLNELELPAEFEDLEGLLRADLRAVVAMLTQRANERLLLTRREYHQLRSKLWNNLTAAVNTPSNPSRPIVADRTPPAIRRPIPLLAAKVLLRMSQIVLGVTGSVAALRVPSLYEALRAEGHRVRVVATEPSLHFFDPRPLPADPSDPLGGPVFRDRDEWAGDRWRRDDPVLHIEFRRWADLLVVAPLDANTLAKFALGLSDNFLTCLFRAWDFDRPVILAPAMNTLMWDSPVTRRHLRQLLEDRGDGRHGDAWTSTRPTPSSPATPRAWSWSRRNPSGSPAATSARGRWRRLASSPRPSVPRQALGQGLGFLADRRITDPGMPTRLDGRPDPATEDGEHPTGWPHDAPNGVVDRLVGADQQLDRGQALLPVQDPEPPSRNGLNHQRGGETLLDQAAHHVEVVTRRLGHIQVFREHPERDSRGASNGDEIRIGHGSAHS